MNSLVAPNHLMPSNLPSSTGNENFLSFIAQARSIAANAGISWDIKLDTAGIALPGEAWDLRQMVNDGRPKSVVLRTFSRLKDAEEKMIGKGLLSVGDSKKGPVSASWQDLISICVFLMRKPT